MTSEYQRVPAYHEQAAVPRRTYEQHHCHCFMPQPGLQGRLGLALSALGGPLGWGGGGGWKHCWSKCQWRWTGVYQGPALCFVFIGVVWVSPGLSGCFSVCVDHSCSSSSVEGVTWGLRQACA